MEKEMNIVTNGNLSISNDNKSVSALNAASSFLYGSVAEYSDRFEKGTLDEKISYIFIIIGIPAHTVGYHYLREAVKLAAGNFEMINNISKKLYPLIASRFNTSNRKVECGIRNAVDIAWNRGKIVNINTIFGFVVYEHYHKPSSSELIALLAEKIYLDGN